jgi:hypothetical protein
MNAGDSSRRSGTVPIARAEGFLIRPMRLSANRLEKWLPYMLLTGFLVLLGGMMALFAGGGIGRVLTGMGWVLVLCGCHCAIAKHLFEKPLADTVMLDNDFLTAERGGRRIGIALTSIHHAEYRYLGFGNHAVVVLHDSRGKANELMFIPADNVRSASDGSHPVVEILLLAVQAAKRVAHQGGAAS